MNSDHADMDVNADAASDHYANTSRIAGYARAGEDVHGVWLAGQIDPDLDDLNLRRFRACGLSGDWRSISGSGGPDALVGMLAVPTAGFPVPRGRPGSQALIAAGAMPSRHAALTASAHRNTVKASDLRKKATKTRDDAALLRDMSLMLAATPEDVIRHHQVAVPQHNSALTAAARLDLQAHDAETAALRAELDALLLP